MMMEARAMMMIEEVLPRNRKNLPLAEAFAKSMALLNVTTSLYIESVNQVLLNPFFLREKLDLSRRTGETAFLQVWLTQS